MRQINVGDLSSLSWTSPKLAWPFEEKRNKKQQAEGSSQRFSLYSRLSSATDSPRGGDVRLMLPCHQYEAFKCSYLAQAWMWPAEGSAGHLSSWPNAFYGLFSRWRREIKPQDFKKTLHLELSLMLLNAVISNASCSLSPGWHLPDLFHFSPAASASCAAWGRLVDL